MKNANTPKIGLCLSGGGSRAMAFHLGCLRALHKHGILNKTSLISTVSGGSVIGAIYAYSNDSFEEFTARVTQQLESGFQEEGDNNIPFSNMTFFSKLKMAFSVCGVALFSPKKEEKLAKIIEDKFYRAEELAAVFEEKLYQGKKLSSDTRDGLEITINACELSTNTAFRFSNKVINNWVLGEASADSVSLAEAVAASAAYPILLSTMNKHFEFEKDGVKEKKEAFLTDGGVYENQGITALFPDRSAEYSYPHYHFDYIIACDADANRPLPRQPISNLLDKFRECLSTLTSRISAMNFKVLYEYESTGKIKGFVLARLNTEDEKILSKDDKFVPYTQVANYPTDFKAMRKEDIELFSNRGEQITDSFVKQYVSDLIE